MNASEIIDQAGGTSKVAEIFEITPSAVTQWRTNGIPKSSIKYLRLLRPDIFASDHIFDGEEDHCFSRGEN